MRFQIPPRFRFLAVIFILLLILAGAFVASHRMNFPGSKSLTTKGRGTATATSPSTSNPGSETATNAISGAASESRENPAPVPGTAPAKPAAPLIPVANRLEPKPAATSVRRQAAAGRSVPEIVRDADMSDPAVRARVVAEMRALEETCSAAVEKEAAKLGIPLRKDGPGNKIATLYDIRDGQPLYKTTLNKNAAISSGANLLYPSPYSLNGSGVRAGVWDGGSVRSNHQELTGRVSLKDTLATVDDHATHVAGTIAASGVQANAKGMAPSTGIDSYDWNDDYAEMTEAGAATAGDAASISLSNHSYGFDGVTTADMGRYEDEARTVDAFVASLPYYLPFWAAGNEQDLLTALGGYQSITFIGLAKNIMTIGAVNDAVSSGVRLPSNGTIASFSSLGPCDDGRIKPDIVANGLSVYSSIGTGNTAYDTYQGTSMATPSAVGSAALLTQLYAREFSGQIMRASTMKALLIHTADDLGNAGPDYKFGWGLINVKAAADLILAHKSSLAAPKLIEGSLTNAAKTQTHTFTWDGVTPIRATLCWTDPAGTAQTAANSRTPNLRHNLDAKITAPDATTIHQPYIMPFVGTWTEASMDSLAIPGKNNVDTVEQVYLPSPTQPGTYTITVSLDGTLSTASQTYSLMVTGGTSVLTNPPPSIAITAPSNGSAYLSGVPINITATASDMAIGNQPGVVSQVEFFHGSTSIGTDATAPYAIDWTPPSEGSYTITAVATDSESASTTSLPIVISVLSGDGIPVISSFSPGSGAGGAEIVLTGSNFAAIIAVRFNGVDAEFTVDSTGQITATIPATATTGLITIVNTFGTGTSALPFAVLQAPVLISQIYGAGGNNGAVYQKDYVELYNRSGSAVSIEGWSVQYASVTGTTWQAIPLTGSIPAGSYYLVTMAGGTTGAVLPAADATGSINMSGTKGKVALRNTSAVFTGSTPSGSPGLQDLVGYGGANAFEGATAPAPSEVNAIFRAGSGAVDTGNNGSDFTASAAAPRNSATGTVPAPVISSASTAAGTVGTEFLYQITASNSPTSFNATGLPDGLEINTTTGAIIGTPTTAGTSNVNLEASNLGGTGTASLAITIAPAPSGGTVTLFSENMGSPSGNTAISTHSFQNSGLTFTGTADVRNTTPSTGYTDASGAGNVFITNSVGRSFEISGIDTSAHTELVLSFGHQKSTTAYSNELVVETSPDGINYTPLTYTRPSGSGTTNWLKIAPTGVIPSAANLRIRFRQTSTGPQFRVDDVVLTGTAITGGTDLTFATWLNAYPTLSDVTPNGDPDGDGIANLVEFFAGLNPGTADGLAIVSSSVASDSISITYRRAKGTTGVIGQVKWSHDLAASSWDSNGITETSLDQGTYELRTASAPRSAGEPTKFLRLEVTQP